MSIVGNRNRYAAIRKAREADVAAACAALVTQGFVRLAKYPAYLIAESGDIYSTHGRRVIRVKPGVKPRGYEFVGLRNDAGTKYEMVHRLVAIAFIPNPDNLPEVNHIDGKKRHNSIDNLEWCTRKHNAQHAFDIGLQKRGSASAHSKLDHGQVRSIRAASGTYRDIGLLHGVSAQTVCNVKRRSRYADVA